MFLRLLRYTLMGVAVMEVVIALLGAGVMTVVGYLLARG
jgi:hypothetical protein